MPSVYRSSLSPGLKTISDGTYLAFSLAPRTSAVFDRRRSGSEPSLAMTGGLCPALQ